MLIWLYMLTPEDLLQAGVHVGHKKSKWNPKMAPFVFGVRNGLHIIDVTKTLEKLNQAIGFLKETVKNDGVILWVGARVQSRQLIEATAQDLNMPFVVGRWIGGLFTNYKIIKERIKYFNDLDHKFAAGELSQYTKKEQLNFERKLKKMRKEMGGIKDLQKLPQVLFITDLGVEKDAMLEAKKCGIKVVALADTSSNPELVDYAIPANNDAAASLEIIIGSIKKELLPFKK